MKRTRRDKSETTPTSSTRNSARSWSRGGFGTHALLATAMLLLSFAQANASQPTQLREWNARWAVLSSAFGETLGATDEAQTRVQGEQLWRWMQSRVASKNAQLSPLQVACWLHEWQAHGVQTPNVKAANDTSSTRSPYVLASQLPHFPTPHVAPQAFAARPFVVSLPSHFAAKLSGVRSNRSHE